MTDREKVIKGLEMSYTYSNVDDDNTLVPQQLVLDTIALLKAQEPATVEPKRIDLANETKAWLDRMDAVDALNNIADICIDWDGYRTANGLGGLINEIWAYARYCADRLLKAQEPITGETSDGYHTFNELYHHRAVLFSVIVANYSDKAWKSKKHHDGTMYDGMFIVGIDTPDGQATYHYDINPYWDMFKCRVLDNAPEWDGHTPAQAIERIGKLKAQEHEALDRQKPDSNIGCWYDITHNYTLEQVVNALKVRELCEDAVSRKYLLDQSYSIKFQTIDESDEEAYVEKVVCVEDIEDAPFVQPMARAMTLEELESSKPDPDTDDNIVWLEWRDGCARVIHIIGIDHLVCAEYPSGLDTLIYEHLDTQSQYEIHGQKLGYIRQMVIDHLHIDNYGKTWRCWTSRPTDEQREATPWN